jgi:hypothetical protein
MPLLWNEDGGFRDEIVQTAINQVLACTNNIASICLWNKKRETLVQRHISKEEGGRRGKSKERAIGPRVRTHTWK